MRPREKKNRMSCAKYMYTNLSFRQHAVGLAHAKAELGSAHGKFALVIEAAVVAAVVPHGAALLGPGHLAYQHRAAHVLALLLRLAQRLSWATPGLRHAVDNRAIDAALQLAAADGAPAGVLLRRGIIAVVRGSCARRQHARSAAGLLHRLALPRGAALSGRRGPQGGSIAGLALQGGVVTVDEVAVGENLNFIARVLPAALPGRGGDDGQLEALLAGREALDAHDVLAGIRLPILRAQREWYRPAEVTGN